MKKNQNTILSLLLSFVVFVFLANPLSGQVNNKQILWKKGEGIYEGYRIPSLIVSSKGTVLAFAEGRNDGGDSGDIGIVLKRSATNGKTWSDETVVWDDQLNTCGNPCPVVDEETGRIWLILTWNYGKDSESGIITKTSQYPRRVFSCYSDDDGLTWSEPADITDACKDPSWGWYATGPGIGIQLKYGNFKGRLVIPANHSYDDPEGKLQKGPYSYGAHVLISDDHGKTWRKSAPIRPGCNESQVAELPDGRLVMNMRSYNGKSCRAVSFSSDGGETWSPIAHDLQLVESVCQASLLDYGNYKSGHYYLFSNPAVPSGRTHMTLKVSDDGCKTWYAGYLIEPGPSAYSCLARLPGGQIGLLFETGENNAYETICFATIQPKNVFTKKKNCMP